MGFQELKWGVQWQPGKRRVRVKIGKPGMALGANIREPFDVVPVNRHCGLAGRAEFPDAKAWIAADGMFAALAPRGGSLAAREQRGQRVAAVKAMLGS